ncbi:MAG: HAMP domain-containing histidine kinase [Anaerolineae bacterium]|nr:HAMP domain-containing histidine kinase [Anaerolineae bacterium]MCA9892276.1 HAMP domain-containing histidine kinase [Anaerolineae bacterium]
MAKLEISDQLAREIVSLANAQNCTVDDLLQRYLVAAYDGPSTSTTPDATEHHSVITPKVLSAADFDTIDNYQNVGGALIMFDEDLNCIIGGGRGAFVSDSFKLYTNHHLADVLPSSLFQRLERAFYAVFEGQESDASDLHYQDGVYHAHITPLWENGVLYAGLLMLQEMPVHAILEDRQHTLENERSRILLKFIQDVSHEFKTPITSIKIDLYLMERNKDPDRVRERMTNIEKQADLIVQLVDDLQAMAKLDSEQAFSAMTTQLDMNDVVRTAYRIAQSKSTGEDTAVISLKMTTGLPRVLGDYDEVTRAIAEVIHNAIRFTPQDGSIVIQTLEEANNVSVLIRDSGIGMTPHTLQRAFQRFHRGDEAHSTPGFGLGLSMAQKIISKHGGDIQINSKPNEGTLVRIDMPTEVALVTAMRMAT